MKFKKGMLLKRLWCGGIYKIENITENYYKLRLIKGGKSAAIQQCTDLDLLHRRYKIINNSVRRLN